MKEKYLKTKKTTASAVSAVSKRIKELNDLIAECNYRMAGYFSYPHWVEDLAKYEKELKKLRRLREL